MQPVEVEGRERCKVESLGSGPRRGQKYMANRIADRVMYLEQRMNGFAAALEQTQATSADKSLSNPGQVCSTWLTCMPSQQHGCLGVVLQLLPSAAGKHTLCRGPVLTELATPQCGRTSLCAGLQAVLLCASASVRVQESEWVVGRVVCDSEGHLNASSVLLEGSLQRMQGCSVKLDLSQLPSYRLFPGQVSHPC